MGISAARIGEFEPIIQQASQNRLSEGRNFLFKSPLRARGKFLYAGDEKFYIRGTTYGAFRPDETGREYSDLELIEYDFAMMAANGLNAVRIPHTMPPRSLLDAAQRHGLRVMVGLSAEQYVGALEDGKATLGEIKELIRAKVRTCAGHPALLAHALGNEIPAPIVRWHGRRWIEHYLEALYGAVKAEDPGGLVTYVNYPSTEYLDLPFLDLVSFNVYLESLERFESYLARLQNVAGERPLVLAEVGLDSLRNGEDSQARFLTGQTRAAFSAGCAGVFVFAWTDEWHRGGEDVEDWAFGLTDRERRPKPALASVRDAFSAVPFPTDFPFPRISVVVCSRNGARTIGDCCRGLKDLDYPDFEVIVIDDGSTDETAAIAGQCGFRVVRTENRGLSSARNTGMNLATGEIVAYIDDDAYPDPHWLSYLAASFLSTNHAGVGGPNLAPSDDGPVADCVARAPGGPVHVLLSDREAEHIPGCNMAFRKQCLEAIGGFDPQFRVAGDDVDVCWRIRDRGWTLGFHPGAVVWHHRRNSVRTYWRQQKGYGKAEAALERKWPEKYTTMGQLSWSGRLYSPGLTASLLYPRGRIYHGTWGCAPYQSMYQPSCNSLWSVTLMCEWYLLITLLGAVTALGLLWKPLLLALPLLAAAVSVSIAQAALSAARVRFGSSAGSKFTMLELRLLTAILHLFQPAARLYGRLTHGLAPWRLLAVCGLAVPRSWKHSLWDTCCQAPDVMLRTLETSLKALGARARRGGDFDRWDLEVRGGLFGAARLLMAAEDVGAGQVRRFRFWPRCAPAGVVFLAAFSGLSAAAFGDGARAAGAALGAAALALAIRMLLDCSAAVAAFRRVLELAEHGDNR